MNTIKLQIENVKHIKNFTIELPFEKGLFAITGKNGIGKSTLFCVLSKLIYKKALNKFLREGVDSSSKLTYWQGTKKNTWIRSHDHWKMEKYYRENNEEIFFNGSFEAGVLFGSRFNSVNKSSLKIFLDKSGSETTKELLKVLDGADKFVIENLGLILHDNNKYYSDLKRLSYELPDFESDSRKIWIKYADFPYFLKLKDELVSYVFLSSGELLMINLLDFINTTILRKESKGDEKYLILIDEIELALHPSAQARLAKFLRDISEKYNFVIYFSTHSIPIIEQTSPSNIFHLRKDITGNLNCYNPCYPVYATRHLYTNNGFDYLLLVEDKLAKIVIELIIDKYSLTDNKLVKVLSCGGWRKVLELHHEFESLNIAGCSCQIISILDGDIENECKEKYPEKQHPYATLTKFFLPISSIEKTIEKKLIKSPDALFVKELGDKFFSHRSLDDILS
ncbi:MAG: AAA family ATPase, partial [Limnothrix sp.]